MACHSRHATEIAIIRLILVSAAMGLAIALHAGDTELVREVDVRSRGEPPGKYVVFCARGGVPGHAFIVWAKDDEKKLVCSVEAFGLYPESVSPNILLFQKVPGEIADEAVRGKGPSTSTIRLVVKISAKQYENTERICAKWVSQGKYALIEHDCVTFSAAVAADLGLKVPDRSKYKLPLAFMRALTEMNGKK